MRIRQRVGKEERRWGGKQEMEGQKGAGGKESPGGGRWEEAGARLR